MYVQTTISCKVMLVVSDAWRVNKKKVTDPRCSDTRCSESISVVFHFILYVMKQ